MLQNVERVAKVAFGSRGLKRQEVAKSISLTFSYIHKRRRQIPTEYLSLKVFLYETLIFLADIFTLLFLKRGKEHV